MSESGNEIEVEEQMADYQHEDLQGEVHRMVDSSERPSLKETKEAKQQSLTDLQGKLNKDDNALEGPRRSERTRHLTEKMRAHQYDEAKKKEKKAVCHVRAVEAPHTEGKRTAKDLYVRESALDSH